MVNTEIRLIILFATKGGGTLYNQQKQDQKRNKQKKDHEFLIAKFRLKLKTVGKTTRPFRYDLNQIPYDYTVEVTNRFKGLDLIECLKKEAGIKTIPQKRNAKRQNGCLRRPYK